MSRYGTIENNIMKPAPRAFMLRGAMVTNPKAGHFADLNEERAKQGLLPYLPIVDEPPPNAPQYGYHWEPRGWACVNGVWMRRYEEVQDLPPPPRTFSKLRVVAALTTAGVWDSVKQLLIERGLYDLFLAAQDFKSDNKYFENGKAALQTALGWTDAQVEAVLAAAEVGA